MDYALVCTKCGHTDDDTRFRCSRCNSILEVRYGYEKRRFSSLVTKGGKGIGRYANFLPVKRLFSLGEGGTRFSPVKINGIDMKVRLKLEMGNPTKTFKDRGSAVELSKAAELGAKEVCCASTGNMGLSVAHYAMHMHINARIFISRNANKAKIRKIKLQGAKLSYVNGDFNNALRNAETYARKTGAFVCGDYHFRKEGQKTVIYEIAEQARQSMPDYLFIPVGNGTLFSGVYKGLTELKMYGMIKRVPRMVAVQSDMCDPLVSAFRNHKAIRYTVPKTEADAIAVGYPTFGFESLNAIKRTKGNAVSVSEKEIESAVRLLEKYKVYAELGGGTGFAGLLKMYETNEKALKGKSAAVVITGNNEGRFA